MMDLIKLSTKVIIVGIMWNFHPLFAVPTALGLGYLGEL